MQNIQIGIIVESAALNSFYKDKKFIYPNCFAPKLAMYPLCLQKLTAVNIKVRFNFYLYKNSASQQFLVTIKILDARYSEWSDKN